MISLKDLMLIKDLVDVALDEGYITEQSPAVQEVMPTLSRNIQLASSSVPQEELEELATILHSENCTLDHNADCGWYYEVSESKANWSRGHTVNGSRMQVKQ